MLLAIDILLSYCVYVQFYWAFLKKKYGRMLGIWSDMMKADIGMAGFPFCTA